MVHTQVPAVLYTQFCPEEGPAVVCIQLCLETDLRAVVFALVVGQTLELLLLHGFESGKFGCLSSHVWFVLIP